MKYCEIKTLDQLEKARKQVKRKIGRKGDDVKESFNDMKDSYSLYRMMVTGLKSISSYVPVDQLLLTTVRRIKRRIAK